MLAGHLNLIVSIFLAVLCHHLQVISRAMGLPIERPKSWTTDGLINKFNLKL